MSIGSWARRMPGATSVTSAVARSCSWRRGRSVIQRQYRPDVRSCRARRGPCDTRPDRPHLRRCGRWRGASTSPGGRSAGCCCGRPAACRPAVRTRRGARSPSSSRPATRPPPSPTSSAPLRGPAAPGRRARRRRRPLDRRHRRRRRPSRRHGSSPRPTCPPAGSASRTPAATGAAATTAPTLVFLDADVRPGPSLLDGLAAAVAADAGRRRRRCSRGTTPSARASGLPRSPTSSR